jgi:hypothetical protein
VDVAWVWSGLLSFWCYIVVSNNEWTSQYLESTLTIFGYSCILVSCPVVKSGSAWQDYDGLDQLTRGAFDKGKASIQRELFNQQEISDTINKKLERVNLCH